MMAVHFSMFVPNSTDLLFLSLSFSSGCSPLFCIEVLASVLLLFHGRMKMTWHCACGPQDLRQEMLTVQAAALGQHPLEEASEATAVDVAALHDLKSSLLQKV